MKAKIHYCPDCGKRLKLADVIEHDFDYPVLPVFDYWCDNCSQHVYFSKTEIKIRRGKKPTQWINLGGKN